MQLCRNHPFAYERLFMWRRLCGGCDEPFDAHLSLHPTLRTCSSDTILRGISELSCANTTYTSDTGKVYDFNTATKLNSLLVKVLMNTSQIVAGASYDLDFDTSS